MSMASIWRFLLDYSVLLRLNPYSVRFYRKWPPDKSGAGYLGFFCRFLFL
jgi:hypothetical protein